MATTANSCFRLVDF